MTKLLLIDDERPVLEMLEISLSCEGYDVLTAENGEEGLRIFEEESPKIVITDIRMPGIDGIEVLKRIRAQDDKAQVIVVTGHGDTNLAAAALQYGASDFIAKPIRDEDLMQGLEKAKNRYEYYQQT